jgi:hypothetical protein
LTFFLALLRGFDFIFFLAVFSAIFLHWDSLFQTFLIKT